MRKQVWLSWLLALLLLASALPAFAAGNAEAKSWDTAGEHLYGIHVTNKGDLKAVAGMYDRYFTYTFVLDERQWFAETLLGDWTIKRLDGDPIEVEVRAEGDEEQGYKPIGDLFLKTGVAGQKATFELRYVSDTLQNPVTKRVLVTVVSESEVASDYVYGVTEHTVMAERDFELPGGKILPESVDRIDAFGWDGSAIEAVGGWIDIDHATGVIRGFIPQPGVYQLYVTVYLSTREGDSKTIVHTITATEYLPPFELNWHELTIDRVIDNNADEWGLTDFWLEDTDRREGDEFAWSWTQTAGEEAPLRIEQNDPWNIYAIIMGKETEEGRAIIAEGQYKYDITLRDVTRDESATAKVTVNVRYKKSSEVQLEGIDYPSLKQASSVTIKAGQTLSLGNPRLLPSDVTMADDTYFGIWIEDLHDGDLEQRMIIADRLDGKHKIVGLKEGEFRVHAFVNMFDDSWGAEQIFTLKVLPAAKPVESIAISPAGTWDDPVRVPVGGKLALKAVVLPKNAAKKTVTWVSDNGFEIDVSKKGVVTSDVLWAMGEIRAFTNDGTNLMDTVVVQFVRPKVTKVSFAKKKYTLKVGDTLSLQPKLQPKNLLDENRELLWMSDNSEVVDIMRYGYTGEIAALKPGKATIYAYAQDEDEIGGASKTVFGKCVITVK